MTINTVLAITGLVVVTVSGCATIAGQLPVPQPHRPSGAFRAGVARVDITPAPGVPMGGHSKAGRIARGYWTRLFARAFVLEDAAGNTVALVSCDLWSVPAGLVDRVAEILLTRAETHHIDRDQLVLAATHTHHSPGNFSTSAFYNVWASASMGFDARLFEFLAQPIAQAIVNAAAARRPATVSHVASPLNGVTRNRSLAAFLLNAERAEVDEGVDPRATALWIREAAAPGRVLGVAAFVAMHPTLLGRATPVYSADIFGVAANYAERTLHGQSPEAVVGLFNGAEGDVSVVSRHRDRGAALRLGERLGQAIVANPARFPPSSALLLAIPVMFPPRAREIADEPGAHRIGNAREDDGDRAGRLLRGKRGRSTWRDDDVRLEANQLGGQVGQSLDPPPCEPDHNGNVLTLDVTELAQPLPEGVELYRGSGRAEEQKADPRNLSRRLRLGGERRGEEPGSTSKERATVHHSIT